MPSPVLMLALVVNGKTLPQPPVARMTAFAVTAWILPVIRPTATTPCTRPSSTSSLVTNTSSYRLTSLVLQRRLEERVQHVEAGLVGREPGALLLHAAERADRDVAVRLPAPRAAPVLELEELLAGPPGRRPRWRPGRRASRCPRSCRRCARRGCRRRRSRRPRRPRRTPCGCASGRPWTSRPRRARGLVSAIAIAARRPAPPPPTISTSWAAGRSAVTHHAAPRPPAPCRCGGRPCGGRCRRGTPRDGSGIRTRSSASRVTRPCWSSVDDAPRRAVARRARAWHRSE